MNFKEVPGGVVDLQWDPNSTNYLLGAWDNGIIQLIDAERFQIMQVFDRQNQGVSTIAWVQSVPGGFITSNNKLAGIKVWNVSNKSPLRTLRVGKCGILNMISLRDTILQDEEFLLSFRNGQVAIFNFKRNKFGFMTEPNHSETIFDTRFQRSNKNILATSSYDGNIRIWDINKMKCLKILERNKGMGQLEGGSKQIIYGISWEPKGDKLVSCNSKGEVVVWDAIKGKVISSITPGSTVQIYRIEWNALDPTYIVSGSAEGYAYVYSFENKKLKVVQDLKHDASVYGTVWDPFDQTQFAVAAGGNIYLYQMVKRRVKQLNMIRAHQLKIFNIAWNPIVNNYIASGSDDQTVKVFETFSGKCIATLKGHNQPVRALEWNAELPWLLLSGSWDFSIRVWDVRTQKCLYVNQQHSADVYGLSSHPERPFIYVSSSRDTTLRMCLYWQSPFILKINIPTEYNDRLQKMGKVALRQRSLGIQNFYYNLQTVWEIQLVAVKKNSEQY